MRFLTEKARFGFVENTYLVENGSIYKLLKSKAMTKA